MVIHKETGSAETREDFPNGNFGEYENVFIIDDNSELGIKVKSFGGYVDFVLDEDGSLVDVTPKEKPFVVLGPNQDDYLLDLDYRVSMVELGVGGV